jgi:chromate transporter
MILNELVNELKWITSRQFFNGLAVVNSLPGPMFNISAYFGFFCLSSVCFSVSLSLSFENHLFIVEMFEGMILGGFLGAVICWNALFGPGLILIFAILPFWKRLRKYKFVIAIMVNVIYSFIHLLLSFVSLFFFLVFTF